MYKMLSLKIWPIAGAGCLPWIGFRILQSRWWSSDEERSERV